MVMVFEQGDIVAFYYNNKILIKRVIAGPGEWVTVDEDGNVYVNNVKLNDDGMPHYAHRPWQPFPYPAGWTNKNGWCHHV